jgi:MYXO-CTERM domain-containing protein
MLFGITSPLADVGSAQEATQAAQTDTATQPAQTQNQGFDVWGLLGLLGLLGLARLRRQPDRGVATTDWPARPIGDRT